MMVYLFFLSSSKLWNYVEEMYVFFPVVYSTNMMVIL